RIHDLGVGALGELRARLLDLQCLAETVQHDIGARTREGFGDAEPDAAGRAGDDGGLALKHVRSPDRWSDRTLRAAPPLLKCRVPTFLIARANRAMHRGTRPVPGGRANAGDRRR